MDKDEIGIYHNECIRVYLASTPPVPGHSEEEFLVWDKDGDVYMCTYNVDEQKFYYFSLIRDDIQEIYFPQFWARIPDGRFKIHFKVWGVEIPNEDIK